MNIIHILGIAILMSTSHSAIEEPKFKAQRTLLRKLQTFEPKENKPLLWNEVLADILVNKIRIFSFKSQAIQSDVKENLTEERSALTNFISQILLVYKQLFYDVLINSPRLSSPIDDIHFNPDVEKKTPEIDDRDVESDEMFVENGITFSDGPKGEVELVEPRYHGKQVLVNDTEEASEVNSEDMKCPDGAVKEGKCVNSKLMLAIPSQCPIGYKRDRLGYCRLIF